MSEEEKKRLRKLKRAKNAKKGQQSICQVVSCGMFS